MHPLKLTRRWMFGQSPTNLLHQKIKIKLWGNYFGRIVVLTRPKQNPYIIHALFSYTARGFLDWRCAEQMAKHCHFVLLLPFVTLVSTTFYVTRKDEADYFAWEGNKIDCHHFRAYGPTPSLCTCYEGTTFSTESSTCESFHDHGTYNVIEHSYIILMHVTQCT